MSGRWRPARNWGARVHEVTAYGHPGVVLENELLRVTVLLTGGHLVEFNHKPRDRDHVWLAPDAVRPPAAGSAAADDVAAFLDSYPGGWQEVLPNGGAPARHRGAALAQHAELTGLRWDAELLVNEPDEVAVRLSVAARRTPLHLSKVLRLRAGDPTLWVDEELTNVAPVAVEAMWGQHLAYGQPFLKPGHRITLPDGIKVHPHPEPINPPQRSVRAGGPHMWPIVPTPDGGETDLSVVPDAGAPSEIVYLSGFGDTGWYELRDPADGSGLRVSWDATVLPYLWLWHELGATTGYPWWGRAYVVGLEPFSSHPTEGLARAVENGTALALAPHATLRLNWSTGVICDG